MATNITPSSLPKLLPVFIILLIISTLAPKAHSQQPDECGSTEITNPCINKSKAVPLKIIAIVTIFITSMIGVCLPLITRTVSALSPDRSLFVIIKCFASGIILATGFMHVLPDSFDALRSDCLPDKPWHKFPFSGFVAMLSAIVTLMVDAMATSVYTRRSTNSIKPDNVNDVTTVEGGAQEIMAVAGGGHGGHFHSHHHQGFKEGSDHVQLTRYRVTAMVLELGIVVHSIVIGLSMGASNNTCAIKGLVAALCFHQMFEGMGLGGSILQAKYKSWKNAVMVFFFSTTTPFGVGLGMAVSSMYKENSPSSLATVGLLNASSAGLLIYMALVDLLAADFMGPKLQGSLKLQIKSFIAILLGAGGMSFLAKWA